jgi:hypothetical protein
MTHTTNQPRLDGDPPESCEGRIHPVTGDDMKRAHDAYLRRDYAEGERLAGAVVAHDPDDLGARTLLAACLYRGGMIIEALDQVEACLTRWPDQDDLELLRDIFTRALAEQLSMRRLCA